MSNEQETTFRFRLATSVKAGLKLGYLYPAETWTPKPPNSLKPEGGGTIDAVCKAKVVGPAFTYAHSQDSGQYVKCRVDLKDNLKLKVENHSGITLKNSPITPTLDKGEYVYMVVLG